VRKPVRKPVQTRAVIIVCTGFGRAPLKGGCPHAGTPPLQGGPGRKKPMRKPVLRTPCMSLRRKEVP
jgi:hypothetical protein